jgi:energy-coupling factor transporter ATP-binding protein EcfA2
VRTEERTRQEHTAQPSNKCGNAAKGKPTTTIEAIEVRGLFRKYDYRVLLEPNVTIIYGPNGVGKSTLLRLVYGVMRPDPAVLESIVFDTITVLFDDGTGLKAVHEWSREEVPDAVLRFIRQGGLGYQRTSIGFDAMDAGRQGRFGYRKSSIGFYRIDAEGETHRWVFGLRPTHWPTFNLSIAEEEQLKAVMTSVFGRSAPHHDREPDGGSDDLWASRVLLIEADRLQRPPKSRGEKKPAADVHRRRTDSTVSTYGSPEKMVHGLNWPRARGAPR